MGVAQKLDGRRVGFLFLLRSVDCMRIPARVNFAFGWWVEVEATCEWKWGATEYSTQGTYSVRLHGPLSILDLPGMPFTPHRQWEAIPLPLLADTRLLQM